MQTKNKKKAYEQERQTFEALLWIAKDFTFDEMVSLFALYGFHIENKGSTSGSRVAFVNENDGVSYIMHKPHPSNIIKGYVMRQVLTFLKANGHIK